MVFNLIMPQAMSKKLQQKNKKIQKKSNMHKNAQKKH
jgi:hypothetical protein